MDEGDTLVNALIGAAIVFFAGNLVPLAPVFGGAVAGYLEGGDRMDGVRVGAFAGFMAYVPLLIVTFAITSLLGAIGLGFGIGFFGPVEPAAGVAGFLGAVVFLLFLFVSFLYFVGGGALGGWVGNYVKYDTDVDV